MIEIVYTSGRTEQVSGQIVTTRDGIMVINIRPHSHCFHESDLRYFNLAAIESWREVSQ